MIDLNLILIPSAVILSLLSFASGAYLILRSFLGFRAQVNYSVNMDLEVIKVSKELKKTGTESGDREGWKEEIGAMEHLLISLAKIKIKNLFFISFFMTIRTFLLRLPIRPIVRKYFFIWPCPRNFARRRKNRYTVFFLTLLLKKFPIIPFSLRAVLRRRRF